MPDFELTPNPVMGAIKSGYSELLSTLSAFVKAISLLLRPIVGTFSYINT